MDLSGERDDERTAESTNPLEGIDAADLQEAEDGSEILFALARIIEQWGQDEAYVDQVRTAAHVVRDLTELHPAAASAERDRASGAHEHVSHLRQVLGLRLGEGHVSTVPAGTQRTRSPGTGRLS